MRTSASPDDPRARRSREQMLTALRDVAQESEPTIAAVSAAAGVTRATFYNHFVSLEDAAWHAMHEVWEDLLMQDAAARLDGSEPGHVGVASLRKIVDVLRANGELVHLADHHRGDGVLPGLADIVRDQVSRFRHEFGAVGTKDHADEDVFIGAGLYAVLVTGAKSERDPSEVATTAYALLPSWMRFAPTSI